MRACDLTVITSLRKMSYNKFPYKEEKATHYERNYVITIENYSFSNFVLYEYLLSQIPNSRERYSGIHKMKTGNRCSFYN